jgi:hypothetical protein
MGEREGEMCSYGEESIGRDGGVEEGYGVIAIVAIVTVEILDWHLSRALEGTRNILCGSMSW